MMDGSILRLVRGVTALVDRPCGLGAAICGAVRKPDPRLVQLRQTAWRLRRSYQQASEGADPEALADLIGALGAATDEALRAIPPWINLIEALAQHAEARFGDHKGALKAEQVKAAMAYLMSRSRSPAIEALQIDPLVLSAVLDLSIDFVVMLLNRHSLWTGQPERAGAVTPLALPGQWLIQVWRWGLEQGLRLVARLHAWLTPRTVLNPAVQAAADHLLQEFRGDPFAPVATVVTLTRLLSRNRKQVAAIADIISAACSEAEQLIHLPGPAKKAYAHDLIVVFVEQYAGRELSAPMRAILDVVTDPLIDAVVGIFNKRGHFQSPESAAPGGTPAAPVA